MPGFDGTGPLGKGAMTGRKRGKCGLNFTGGRYSSGLKFMPIILPVAVAIVHDIFKPDSITRKFGKALIGAFFKKEKQSQ